MNLINKQQSTTIINRGKIERLSQKEDFYIEFVDCDITTPFRKQDGGEVGENVLLKGLNLRIEPG